MTYRVLFSPEAQDDLRQLYLFVSQRAGPRRALAYIERIEAYCLGFSTFPARGIRRDDLLNGLRIVGFERRITLAYHVTDDSVTFDRILYGGRDLDDLFSEV